MTWPELGSLSAPRARGRVCNLCGMLLAREERTPGARTRQWGSRPWTRAYTNVPAMAAKIPINSTNIPVPTRANMGPGQAPSSAQPIPNSVPPIQ